MADKPEDAAGRVVEPEDLAAFWDAKYETAAHFFGDKPNAFIRDQAEKLPRGRALLPGDGDGRNGVWLARQGFDVTAVDVSPLALAHARDFAGAMGVSLETIAADLDDWTPEAGAYGLAAAAFVHIPARARRAVHEKYAAALAPGGVLLFQAYSQGQLGRTSGGPKSLELLYRLDDIRADFSALRLERAVEEIVILDEGPKHRGAACVITVIARKPA